MSDQRGWASSAQVYRENWGTAPVWKWTASGPGGMTMGSAKSEAEAWERAREAQRQLNRSLGPRRIG